MLFRPSDWRRRCISLKEESERRFSQPSSTASDYLRGSEYEEDLRILSVDEKILQSVDKARSRTLQELLPVSSVVNKNISNESTDFGVNRVQRFNERLPSNRWTRFIPKSVDSLDLFSDRSLSQAYLQAVADAELKEKYQKFLSICHEIPLKRKLEYDLHCDASYLDALLQRNNLSSIDMKGSDKKKPLKPPSSSHVFSEPVEDYEFILRFQLWSSHSDTLQQEFEVLGSQTLEEVEDCIYCLQSIDAHQDGKPATSFSSKRDFFFFVEGNFYINPAIGDEAWNAMGAAWDWLEENNASPSNCLSLGANIDDSKASSKRRRIEEAPPRSVGEMFGVHGSSENTTYIARDVALQNIPMRLGMKYLFWHASGCEHFLYLTELRMHTAVYDRINKVDYPLVVYQNKLRRRRCGVCEIWSARFVVYNDRLASSSPAFYCQHCYHCLHYTPDDILLYSDFDVFPYLHDMK